MSAAFALRGVCVRTSRDGLTNYSATTYQLDFITPGISPFSASPRKHRRQMPNLRRNARGRPQILQRLCCRVENLGFLFALATCDVLAIVSFLAVSSQPSAFSKTFYSALTTDDWLLTTDYCRNGMPICFSRARA